MKRSVDYEKIVSQIRYKPGWKFQLSQGLTRLGLYVAAEMIDVKTKKPSVYTYCMVIKPSWTKKQFLSAISWLVRSLELHQMDEWLAVGGKRLKKVDHKPFKLDKGL